MPSSRTKNATRNILAGFVNKFVVLVLPFFTRAIIIRLLGAEYLGLSSLFTSILNILNLAELGFDSAIVYSMYKPIAQGNTQQICALMNLYRRTYHKIGLGVLVVGLAVMPFLSFLIKDGYPSDINIYFLYLIYLFNTVITCFLFAYKMAVVTAHQRSDLVSNTQTVLTIIQSIAQIAVLLLTQNYYLFAAIQIATQIIAHLIVNYLTNKKYPQYHCAGEVSAAEKQDLKKRVAGLMIHRICGASRNSLDSIFISLFLGLNMVAIYSNYYSIMAAVSGIMGIIVTALVASIGNSIVTEPEPKNYQDMNNFNFIYMWLAGWATATMLCLFQPFMQIWMGQDYLLPLGVVILFCTYFYALMMGNIRAAYSDAKGLWYENRHRAIAETIANVALNIVLGKLFGIYGIIIGTLLSLLIINFGYGSQLLFRHYFKHQKPAEYYLRHGLYALVTFFVCVVTYAASTLITSDAMAGIIERGAFCLIIPNVIYFCLYHRTKYFNDASKVIKKIGSRQKGDK